MEQTLDYQIQNEKNINLQIQNIKTTTMLFFKIALFGCVLCVQGFTRLAKL